MNWFYIGCLLMEDDLKQCGFFNEPSSIPRFYTPKWIDRIVNKYGIYKDM